jgi:hypothetical protein
VTHPLFTQVFTPVGMVYMVRDRLVSNTKPVWYDLHIFGKMNLTLFYLPND